MTFAAEITDRAAALVALVGADVEPHDLTARVSQLSDAEAVSVAEAAAAIVRCAELAQVTAVGVIATRSTRDAGHSGLAQSRGHRTTISLVQELTGSGKAAAARKVRVGEALLSGHETDAAGGVDAAGGANAAGGSSPAAEVPLWDAPLSTALLTQDITADQHDAIRQGLGAPPVIDAESGDADAVAAAHAEAHEAWSLAAEQLVAEAGARSLEELRSAARMIRDRLDPEGARRRFQERFERRCFRTWIDGDGYRRGSFIFDDDGALLVQTLHDSALRPRRGGPQFVDSAERERAKKLKDDERTNDQLAYDLLIDVLRAGMLADAETVFGTRQAGVRVVQVAPTPEQPTATAHSEDGLVSLPGEAADQHICDSGFVPVTVDERGNPLDVGREHRLFTPRQRIALAIRDGGCMWPSCDRPASYCEAHHTDHWSEHDGRTDIDRGILLCRFHHMQLHHRGWRITRQGKDDPVLHHPDGGQTALHRRAALSYAWAGIDPPPRRFRPTG